MEVEFEEGSERRTKGRGKFVFSLFFFALLLAKQMHFRRFTVLAIIWQNDGAQKPNSGFVVCRAAPSHARTPDEAVK